MLKRVLGSEPGLRIARPPASHASASLCKMQHNCSSYSLSKMRVKQIAPVCKPVKGRDNTQRGGKNQTNPTFYTEYWLPELRDCKKHPLDFAEKDRMKTFLVRKSRNCISSRKCTLHNEPNFGQVAHHRKHGVGFLHSFQEHAHARTHADYVHDYINIQFHLHFSVQTQNPTSRTGGTDQDTMRKVKSSALSVSIDYRSRL